MRQVFYYNDFTTKSDSCYKMRRLLQIATVNLNLWLSEFAITGEGTVICKEMNVCFIIVDVMNFFYIHVPFINCSNKIADVWFDWFFQGFFLVPSCLLFVIFFYLVLALLFWLFSSQKILSSRYNKFPVEMKH